MALITMLCVGGLNAQDALNVKHKRAKIQMLKSLQQDATQQQVSHAAMSNVSNRFQEPIRANFFEDVESHTNFTINSTTNGWSYIDGDNSTNYGYQGLNNVTYPGQFEASAFQVFNPSATSPSLLNLEPGSEPHSGSKFFGFWAAVMPADGGNGPNNDWLISPQLSSPTKLSFWAKSFTDEYGLERMKVGYSTTGTAQGDFTFLTASPYVSVPATDWTEYEYELPSGTKYIAINCVSQDAFLFMVDDITIEQGGDDNPCPAVTNLAAAVQGTDVKLTWTAATGSPTGYKVYDGTTTLATVTTTEYTATGLTGGPHTLGVEALYSEDCTPVQVTTDVTIGNCDGVSNMTVAIDPSNCNATISWDAATKAGRALLWDNTAGGSQTGYHNVTWTGDPTGACLLQADDFIVTGNGWIIEEVYAYGFNSTSSGTYPVPPFMGVSIYADNGNNRPLLPAIYENNALSATSGSNTDEMTIPLTDPFTIAEAGKYWISIHGVHTGAASGTQQYWTTISSTAKESPMCRWDPTNMYETSPYYPDWAPNDDTAYPSCVFSISGQTISDPGVATYNVYRDGVKIAGPIEATTYTDENVTAGTEYEWAVAVVCANGADSEWSRLKGTCGAAPCDPPTNLAGALDPECTLTLTWEGTAGGYNVYKDGTEVAQNTQSPYTENLENGTYKFEVEAVCGDVVSEKVATDVTANCVGISNLALESLRIYPNPASSTVTIECNDVAKVEVYNAVGQLMKTTTETSVDVSSYNTGIYFFKVYDSNNNAVTKRVMVTK